MHSFHSDLFCVARLFQLLETVLKAFCLLIVINPKWLLRIHASLVVVVVEVIFLKTFCLENCNAKIDDGLCCWRAREKAISVCLSSFHASREGIERTIIAIQIYDLITYLAYLN